MKKIVFLLAVLIGVSVCAGEFRDPSTFYNDVRINDGATIDVVGPLKIGGVKVTATPQQLNEVGNTISRSTNNAANIVKLTNDAGVLSTQKVDYADGTYMDTVALAASALQPSICGVSGSVASAVATVVVTNSRAGQTVMVGWLSTTAGGVASDDNLTSIVVDGDSLLLSASDNPTTVFRTHSDGKTTFTITFSNASTNYFNVLQRDGIIVSSGEFIPAP